MNTSQHSVQSWNDLIRMQPKSFFSLLFIITLTLVHISCEEEPKDYMLPLSHSVKFKSIDSATGETVPYVEIMEKRGSVADSLVVSGDTLKSWKETYGLVVVRKRWYHDGVDTLFPLGFEYRGYIHPNYDNFLASKPGYRLWKYSKIRDTVFSLGKNYDSLCIRLVKK